MVNNPLIRTYFLGKHGRRGTLKLPWIQLFQEQAIWSWNFTKSARCNPQAACIVTICNSHMLLFQQWKTVAQRAQLHPRSSMEACMMILNTLRWCQKTMQAFCFSWILGLSHLHLWRNLLVHNLIYCLNAKLFPYNLIQPFKTSTLCNLWFVSHTAIWVLQSSNSLGSR